jgi:hypothetical protein
MNKYHWWTLIKSKSSNQPIIEERLRKTNYGTGEDEIQIGDRVRVYRGGCLMTLLRREWWDGEVVSYNRVRLDTGREIDILGSNILKIVKIGSGSYQSGYANI